MIKLLIAEDQVLIQKDICRKIEKTGKNMRIVATALNGQEAYEKIMSLHPDIFITDIRMPMQSGLELIRRLKNEQVSIKTVIISGYKDFEYAKEAIQLGVDEYLLKPVSIDDLKYVLDVLEEKIHSEQNYNFHHALYLMLNSGIPIPQTTIDPLDFAFCRLMLINLNSYATFSIQDWFPYENEVNELLNGHIINKYLKKDESYVVCNGQTYNQRLIIFLLHKTNDEKLTMLAAELQKHIEKLSVTSTICLSNPVQDINSLGAEYKLLNTQLSKQLIFAYSSILHSKGFLDSIQSLSVFPDNMDDKTLRFCMLTQSPENLLEYLDQFLESCQAKKTTQNDLSNALKHILHVCFDGNGNLISKELEIDEYLSNTKTYTELKLSLRLLFEQLFKKKILKLNSVSNPETLIASVKEYIHNNYGKEININDIAIHFSITPAYLSRLFKKYTDIRPIEYLTSYRIQRACDYFSRSQLTVREVAELCGYSNQFYFSKAFKQITSVSPSEYRIQHQQNPAE